MKKRKCYLFIFDGYADWEPALAVACLNRYSDFSIHSFSPDGLMVESMGGIKIQPDFSLSEVNAADVDLLILPGGDAWSNGTNDVVARLVRHVASRRATLAAICDATVFIAKLGYLNNVWHTSNGPSYLREKVPSYRGKHYFEDLPCVVDKNFITANGAGMIEFAMEILRLHNVLDATTQEKVYELYKSGGVKNKLYQ